MLRPVLCVEEAAAVWRAEFAFDRVSHKPEELDIGAYGARHPPGAGVALLAAAHSAANHAKHLHPNVILPHAVEVVN